MAETGSSAESRKDFFISFTGKNKQWAEWIAWQLEAAGYSVIIQTWDFHAGNNISIVMDEALRNSERVIAVISPDYFQSAFTPSEWSVAYHRDPKGERGLLVPVLVEMYEERGLLGPIAYIDLRGYDEERAREKLINGISRRRNKPALAPMFPGAAAQAKQVPTQSKSLQAEPPFPGPTTPGTQDGPVKVFFSYATQDTNMLNELKKHLATYERQERITCWDKRQILAGDNKLATARHELTRSNIVFLLISAAYLASPECYDEMEYAQKRIQPGKTATVPVRVREVAGLEITSLNDLQMIPHTDKPPVDQWKNRDQAWTEVVKGFVRVLNGLKSRPPA